MVLAARLDGRTLRLEGEGLAPLAFALDRGGRYRIVVHDGDDAHAVVDALDACPGVGILPAGGGLLGTLTVAENFALVLRYGADPRDDDTLDGQRALHSAFAACGLAPERIAALGRERPLALERTERWLTGLVRHLLRPPELLVIDRAFAGLSRRQAQRVIELDAVFHAVHPFRPVLFVDVDAHELPAIPGCVRHSLFEAAPCPC